MKAVNQYSCSMTWVCEILHPGLPLNHTPTQYFTKWTWSLWYSNIGCIEVTYALILWPYSCGDTWTRAWSNWTIPWFQQPRASPCNRLWGENNVILFMSSYALSLSLIQLLNSSSQVPVTDYQEKTAMKTLLQWCQRTTQGWVACSQLFLWHGDELLTA